MGTGENSSLLLVLNFSSNTNFYLLDGNVFARVRIYLDRLHNRSPDVELMGLMHIWWSAFSICFDIPVPGTTNLPLNIALDASHKSRQRVTVFKLEMPSR